jgi:hypothetical protein
VKILATLLVPAALAIAAPAAKAAMPVAPVEAPALIASAQSLAAQAHRRCARVYGSRLVGSRYVGGGRVICTHRVSRTPRGAWRATSAAWRHCTRKYGASRVVRALENRTHYRCIWR